MARQPRSTPTASSALEKHLAYLRGKLVKLETKWLEQGGAIQAEIDQTTRALEALK